MTDDHRCPNCDQEYSVDELGERIFIPKPISIEFACDGCDVMLEAWVEWEPSFGPLRKAEVTHER